MKKIAKTSLVFLTICVIMISLTFLFTKALIVTKAIAGDCPAGQTATYTCPSGFTLSSDNSTCSSPPDCPTGSTYNASTNRCEMAQASSDSSGQTCQSGWNYDTANKVCYLINPPTCPSGSTLQNNQCQVQPTIACDQGGSGNGQTLSGYYCFSSDSNGDITNQQQCINTGSGYLCPMAMQQCTATYQQATCSYNGTLNASLNKCTTSPNITCPSGYTYDSNVDTCVASAICPNGGLLNPNTDKCEIVLTSSNCPSGYTYNTTYDACVKTPSCPSGGTYNASRDRCEYQVVKSCPSGYTYDSGNNVCTASPQCPSGTTFNSTYNKCLVSATLSCLSGYSQSGNICVANPQCPSGSYFDTNLHQCVMQGTVGCPNGGTYSNGQCVMGATQGFANGQTCVTDSLGNTFCLLFSNGNMAVSSNGVLGNWVSMTTGGASANNSSPSIEVSISSNNFCLTNIISLYPYNASQVCVSFSGGDTGWAYNTFYFNYFIIDAVYLEIQVSNGQIRLNSHIVGSASGGFVVSPIPPAYGNWTPFYTTTCPSGWTLSGNQCTQPASTTCPSGWSLSGSICVKSASCPAGGWLNSSTNQCQANLSTNCPSGTSYDSIINYCSSSPSCPSGGSFNASAHQCQISVTNVCPTSYTYDSSTNICYSSPICNYGIYNSSVDLCELAAASLCPSGYTFDSSSNKCLTAPQCASPGSYSTTLDKCGTLASYNCPTNYTYAPTDKLCEADPLCTAGTYNSSNQECYVGDTTCPAGNYQCLPYNGANYCSPYPCINMSDPNNSQTDQADLSSYTNDGQHDDNGNCLGQIYIFTGKGSECRPAGVSTFFTNCCSDSTFKKQGRILFVIPQCNHVDANTVQLRQSGVCHEVGTYCAWKVLGVCLQKRDVYCCFHSKLGRIIHEQGRPQLADFGYSGDWGEPKHPNCRGFTPDEFQMLDFDKIDLSEYFGDIENTISSQTGQIQQKAQQNISNFYNQTQSNQSPY